MATKKRPRGKVKKAMLCQAGPDVDTVAAEIGYFVRERISEFNNLQQIQSAADEECFGYTLRDIALRALLVVTQGDEVHQYFVESLLAAGNDLEEFKGALNKLDVANVQHWLKVPPPPAKKPAAA